MGSWNTAPGGTDAGSADVRARLEVLAATGATGRLAVRGVAGGWIHLDGGAIACAERTGRPTLLVAMGEAGLFSPEEWQVALRLPFASKWETLCGGDAGRRAGLEAFAHAFVVDAVAALVDPCRTGRALATFSPGVTHAFGPLRTWTLGDVLADAPAPPPRAQTEPFDRAEFLELLEEVSPHVRRVPGGGLRAEAIAAR